MFLSVCECVSVCILVQYVRAMVHFSHHPKYHTKYKPVVARARFTIELHVDEFRVSGNASDVDTMTI